MHIFSDLQPYICTFTACRDGLAQFPSRAAWAEHEFSEHRILRLWACPECPKDFPDASSWKMHLQERHRLSFSGPNLQTAKNMALKTEARQIENDECPLCCITVGKPRRGFVKHVGRHLEEIALMALPRNVEDDTEEGSTSTDRTSFTQGNTRPTQPEVAPAAQIVAPNISLNPIQGSTAQAPSSSMPVLPPPTMQEVEVARCQLPKSLRAASDEQLRYMILNKRRHEYFKQQQQRMLMQQEANGQQDQSDGRLHLKPPTETDKGKFPFDSNVTPMRAMGRTDLENTRELASLHGRSSPSINGVPPPSGSSSSPRMTQPQALSSGMTPAVNQLSSQFKARHPQASPEQITRMTTDQLYKMSNDARQQAMQAAAGTSNVAAASANANMGLQVPIEINVSFAQAPLENEAVNERSEPSRHPTPTMSKDRVQSANQLTLEEDQHHQLAQDQEGESRMLPIGELPSAGQRSAPRMFDLQQSTANMKAFMHEADHERNQLQVHKDANDYTEKSKDSGGSPDPNSKDLRGSAAASGRCLSCNRAETPVWRRGPDGARTL